MELHPIVKRVLQFKLGETKLSAAAEKALAFDYYRFVTGDETFGTLRDVDQTEEVSEAPAGLIAEILAVISVPLSPTGVREQLKRRGLDRSLNSIRKALYKARDQGRLKSTPDGRYTVAKR